MEKLWIACGSIRKTGRDSVATDRHFEEDL